MARRKKKKDTASPFIIIPVLALIAGLTWLAFLWWENYDHSGIAYPEFGIPIPSSYNIHGIDVSRYQQRISWEEVKDMNVDGIQMGFAFIKATEGVESVDPFFKRNWKRSKEAGIIRGAYHFFLPNKDGLKQARNFIKQVQLEQGDLPPVIDIEQTMGMTKTALRNEVKKYLTALEKHYNVKPIIYTGADFYKQNLTGHFDDYPLWVAHYLQPFAPRISREWSFWQHSDRGRVNGISSKVDFNVFSGDSLAFRSLLVP